MLACNAMVPNAGNGQTELAPVDPVASMQAIDQQLPSDRERYGAKLEGSTEFRITRPLRYEITRKFSPYLGVTYARKLAGSASSAHALAEPTGESRVTIGIRN